ncbi:MAG: hypothetical protein LBM12_00740 [Candidatus Nomurabacteria bacterium]|jgi:hypothetical protein|nr:hypothetical protein [Candidatus Nomurabacteria bacterium]
MKKDEAINCALLAWAGVGGLILANLVATAAFNTDLVEVALRIMSYLDNFLGGGILRRIISILAVGIIGVAIPLVILKARDDDASPKKAL